jgi:peptidoglycan/xylan/chitin deacetylase (PgdA/CDA1 family)
MTNWIFKILRYSGIPFLMREILQRNKVTILLFHDLAQADAQRNFQYLKRHYNIISLNLFIEAIQKSDASLIPKKALIITFDDGHKSNFHLLQTFAQMNIDATIFLCSGIINTQRKYWFKHQANGMNISQLKNVSNQERLSHLSLFHFSEVKDFPSRQAMTKDEIMSLSKVVNMQSHTHFHPILPNCSDEEAFFELNESKAHLETEYGFSINTISYPNGDYSERDIELAKQIGYACGVTVDFGYNDVNSDLFRLKRISANDTSDLNELIVKSSGLWAFLKHRGGSKQPYGWKEAKFR